MLSIGIPLGVRRFCTILLIAFAAWGCSALAAGAAKGALFYCNQGVPPYSFCPSYLNINNDAFNWNQAYAKGINGFPVCERATIRYHAQNISYRCGGSPVGSQCDLVGYPVVTTFSVYTGNNSSGSVYMVGKVDYVYCE